MTLLRPTTIEEHIQHAKMKLGEPVIRVNVTEDQARACVYEAVDKFVEYHDEASDEGIYFQEIDQQIKDEQGIRVDDSVISVIEVMGTSTLGSSGTVIQGGGDTYSLMDVHRMIGQTNSKLSMFLAQRDLSYFRNILTPPPIYRYNESTKFLAIEEPDDNFVIGENIVYRAIFSLENIAESNFWRDVWLLKYTTAIIKKQWASNITKYNNVELPGGYTLNGGELMSQAKEEIKDLEEELYDAASVMRTVMTIG